MNTIYSAPHLKRSHYHAPLVEHDKILGLLRSRSDPESDRLQKYISLPDLTRTDGSPIKSIIDRIISLPSLRNFDIIETPEIISPAVVFDLFNFPQDHPARSSSDTYYVDEEHILRPHTSLMWKYYLDIPAVRQRLKEHGSVGVLSYGKVYRKDEIDWQHTNVFHQVDGLFVCRRTIKSIGQTALEEILLEIATTLYGEKVQSRFNVDHFPYTDPSLEMEIAWGNRWIEILGGGIVHPNVIENLNLDSKIYGAWAFGFGVDRLAMVKMHIPDIRLLRSTDERVLKQLKNIDNVYQPVSKYPPIVRDISFVVEQKSFNINRYYEIIREVINEDYIEEAKLLDQYEDEKKFGTGKVSYTFRIVYRHLDRTLTNKEVDVLHGKLEEITKKYFFASVR